MECAWRAATPPPRWQVPNEKTLSTVTHRVGWPRVNRLSYRRAPWAPGRKWPERLPTARRVEVAALPLVCSASWSGRSRVDVPAHFRPSKSRLHLPPLEWSSVSSLRFVITRAFVQPSQQRDRDSYIDENWAEEDEGCPERGRRNQMNANLPQRRHALYCEARFQIAQLECTGTSKANSKHPLAPVCWLITYGAEIILR